MSHYEPIHQDLRCLQIQLFSSMVVKELISLYFFLESGYRKANKYEKMVTNKYCPTSWFKDVSGYNRYQMDVKGIIFSIPPVFFSLQPPASVRPSLSVHLSMYTIFIDLLKTHWANQSQILYRASVGWGTKVCSGDGEMKAV